MQADSLLLKRLVTAGAPLLVGGMLRECHARPAGPGLVLGFAAPGGFRSCLFSIDRRYSRWHLTPDLPARLETQENHLTLVARQKLIGAQLTDLTIAPGERVLTTVWERHSFTGERETYRLIAELMGPYSNLLVLDDSNTILATWKIAHSYENEYREIRPGKDYVPPPPSGHHPMRALTVAEWAAFFEQQPLESTLQAALLRVFTGITPGVIQAAITTLDWEPRIPIAEVTRDKFAAWAATIEDLWVEVEAGTRLPPWEEWFNRQAEGLELHLAVAELYDSWELAEREAERAQSWRAALKSRAADLQKLRGRYLEEKGTHHANLKLRHLGDLIFANLHLFPSGKLGYETTIQVPDAFAVPPTLPDSDPDTLTLTELERLTDPDPPLVAITLPAEKSAQQYAKDIHHKASRAQRGIAELEQRLAQVARDLEQLEELKLDWQRFATIDPKSWQMVLKSLREGKDLPRFKGSGHPLRVGPKGIEHVPNLLKGLNLHVYRLPHGLKALVGGNANANEALWRYGEPEYIWLHTKGVPGSHVLIPSAQGQIPAESLLEAARLAVSHSSVKEGTKIPVDYVQCRYLRKPPGTPPGYVTFTRERTLLVNPFNALELKRRKLWP